MHELDTSKVSSRAESSRDEPRGIWAILGRACETPPMSLVRPSSSISQYFDGLVFQPIDTNACSDDGCL